MAGTLALAVQSDPAELDLTRGANEALAAYAKRLEPQLRARGARLGHIGKWAGKLVGTNAGLLHLAGHVEGGYGAPVAEATMRAAIEVGDYFAEHALTVFDLMGADAAQARARTVLDVLAANGWDTISRRDLFAKLSRSEFPTVAELEPALALLEDHGYLRSHTPPRNGKRGRPPAPRYVVHPQVREGTT